MTGSGQRPVRKRRPSGPAYDWRDHPDSMETPPCDSCVHRARWSICRMEQLKPDREEWVVRAFACGQHLNAVLDDLEWWLDAVQIYDLAAIPEGGC